MQVRTGIAKSKDAKSGDLDIYYEDMGDPNDPAVLLIMGLGAQLLMWRKGFCERLIDQGLRVIRFDNRDVGLSSKLRGLHTDTPLVPRMLRSLVGMRSPAAYTLEDMADDAAALLDHLEIERAHIVGASMGGMIAQVFAARHKTRTRSLAIIFSSNNKALLPPPGPRQLLAILRRPKGNTREAVIENAVRVSKIIGSPDFPASVERLRADAIDDYDRCYYPAGIGRHFAAILGSGSLLHHDREIKAPTLVLHGKADKLMRPSGGRAIANAIEDARLVLFDGMGHELPEPLWDDIIGELKTIFAAPI
ncbi:hydrolase [Mycobacterium sp. IS-1590]|uniref:alpha/beta fold hydrolase n=1 Tax=Mycobacterium sp. IS-1590 TaxID=1772286 RepID=UPI0007487818|nr:alpha/beta hydrolase [Mycobacterium sp. IS-1590]KUI44993.1 hydrolase [Mycobacterium sp. IS-1590]